MALAVLAAELLAVLLLLATVPAEGTVAVVSAAPGEAAEAAEPEAVGAGVAAGGLAAGALPGEEAC